MNFAPLKPRHALVLAALSLAACQQHKAPETQATAEASPDAKPGIKVSDGVLMLPAVKGNPGAAYFTVANGSAQPTALAAVSVDGAATAEMHDGSMTQIKELALKPGETAKFERGGKHVMVFGLTDAAKSGGTAEMTLTFAGGDKISVPLKVQSMSDAMAGDMAAMEKHN